MRTLRRGERSFRVADGKETEVKVVGYLPLVLHGSFTLHLNNVLYVLTLSRNLISISLLLDIDLSLFRNVPS